MYEYRTAAVHIFPLKAKTVGTMKYKFPQGRCQI